MTYSFFLIKPDAIERNLYCPVLHRIQSVATTYPALRIVRCELRRATRELAAAHYAEHVGRSFFDANVEFLASGPLVAGVVECDGGDAVALLRAIAGPYDGRVAGTIRGTFMRDGEPLHENLIHTSDSPEAAVREAELWFGPGGLSPV